MPTIEYLSRIDNAHSPLNFSKHLSGEKIFKIARRSKYLIFHLKKKLLLAHFGMTGKLLLMRNRDNIIFKTSF